MPSGRELIQLVAQRQDLDQFRRKNWEGTFEEYLDIVRANPRVTRNAFERVVLCNALGLTLRARVDAISEEPARIVALLTSTLQRHVRVCAKRQ